MIRKALYPEGHPYSWTVIGQLPDLQAAELSDLREFYDRYYGAGNATLAIVGDIDVAETKEAVRYWFGEIRQGPEVTPPEAEITKNKVIKDAARAQESLNAKLGLLREKSKYALPGTFVEDRQARLLDLSAGDLAAAAGGVMAPSDLVWVVVGDAKTQAEAVRDFADALPGGRLVEVERAAGTPSGD